MKEEWSQFFFLLQRDTLEQLLNTKCPIFDKDLLTFQLELGNAKIWNGRLLI